MLQGGKRIKYSQTGTKSDIDTAKNAHVKSVGCLYIKHPEIMLDAKPDYVISNLLELLKVLGE